LIRIFGKTGKESLKLRHKNRRRLIDQGKRVRTVCLSFLGVFRFIRPCLWLSAHTWRREPLP
jgi:hypothetical protein